MIDKLIYVFFEKVLLWMNHAQFFLWVNIEITQASLLSFGAYFDLYDLSEIDF